MERTQLQKRIEMSVRTGKSFSQDVYFMDPMYDTKQPFIDGIYQGYFSEDDVKHGETYEDVKPAIQARLSQMESNNECCEIISKYFRHGNSVFSRGIGYYKLIKMGNRNGRLKRKAVKNMTKRKGGAILFALDRIFDSYLVEGFINSQASK